MEISRTVWLTDAVAGTSKITSTSLLELQLVLWLQFSKLEHSYPPSLWDVSVM